VSCLLLLLLVIVTCVLWDADTYCHRLRNKIRVLEETVSALKARRPL
jgi:hypothetical protein